jgi:hypothetical protein
MYYIVTDGDSYGGIGNEIVNIRYSKETIIFDYEGLHMLGIANLRNATDNEWDTLWNSSKAATYYHSREWAEIWQSYTNGRIRPEPKLIIFSDGVTALLPFSKQFFMGGFINRYSLTGPPAMALPYYGNWLTNDSLTDDHIVLLTKLLIAKFRNMVWRLNPYDENSDKVYVNSKYAIRRPLVTYMIDLSKGEESILSNMKQSCRNQIRQGVRNNLKVTEGTEIEHWRAYYDIYSDTLNRWGAKAIYKLDWKIFEIIFSRKSPNVKLWLVWHDSIAIAGCVCVYSHGKIITWHISSLTEYHKLRPVNMLKYAVIKEGISKNYRWLDFETAGRNKGLMDFKKSFGPEEKMCDMIINWHPIVYTIKRYII